MGTQKPRHAASLDMYGENVAGQTKLQSNTPPPPTPALSPRYTISCLCATGFRGKVCDTVQVMGSHTPELFTGNTGFPTKTVSANL